MWSTGYWPGGQVGYWAAGYWPDTSGGAPFPHVGHARHRRVILAGR